MKVNTYICHYTAYFYDYGLGAKTTSRHSVIVEAEDKLEAEEKAIDKVREKHINDIGRILEDVEVPVINMLV